jgi:hypothetical protein
VLATGNLKLGRLVHSFSIPARHTCPGATAACLAACYARRGHFNWEQTRQAHEHNWRQSLGEDFVAEILAEIVLKGVRILRVHTAGDFYDAGYVRKWIEIARRSPTTTLFAYTRSWWLEEMQPALQELARLKNVRLWLSADRDTGRPPRWRRARVAYMYDEEKAGVPAWADLVFRVKRKRGVRKYIDGKFVCPPENGVVTKAHVGCSECKLCFSQRPIPQKLVQIGA